MCILFMFIGNTDLEGDYSLIIASNRDEYLDRPTLDMAAWIEDPEVFGGRDLQSSSRGTWLAVSPVRHKIGVLLNIPSKIINNAESRGKVIEDYIKTPQSFKDYISCNKEYITKCNGFIFVSAELGVKEEYWYPTIRTFNNISNTEITHTSDVLGFGNSLPNEPLLKVKAGNDKMKQICTKFNKIDDKTQLIKELLSLLKSEHRHLPDAQLQEKNHDSLSSIFVSVPEIRYGTRTHTLILLTKSGHMDIIEETLVSPIDLKAPQWKRTEYQFQLC
ncbi:hypothetical protein ACJJTC_001533 [Scirpophaga incertulas]